LFIVLENTPNTESTLYVAILDIAKEKCNKLWINGTISSRIFGTLRVAKSGKETRDQAS
jgi:hypothetical protein